MNDWCCRQMWVERSRRSDRAPHLRLLFLLNRQRLSLNWKLHLQQYI
ncbi:MAG: hypothetical protein PUP92_22630 [Rhizonema sp. PD38]|nr:hypothetical protein [Rhizonema sp. PD38]